MVELRILRKIANQEGTNKLTYQEMKEKVEKEYQSIIDNLDLRLITEASRGATKLVVYTHNLSGEEHRYIMEICNHEKAVVNIHMINRLICRFDLDIKRLYDYLEESNYNPIIDFEVSKFNGFSILLIIEWG